ncbi:MAG: DUF1638 domain-containing protein [Acidobacteriia bacterium]|nr:DUF1638 domain-containing protein [Terriglobia bacterium]
MRLKLISCEVIHREMSAAIACSPHQVDAEFLPKGLHSLGGRAMQARLQEAADHAGSTPYDAVLFGYALCGNGTAGLASRTVPFVIPRAHDCIALLMGGDERHRIYREDHPGVYYRSPGWLERGQELEQAALEQVRQRTGSGFSLEQLIARYGPENGRFLFGQFQGYERNYEQLTYISTGLEPDASFEARARREAGSRGWRFESVPGDLSLFAKLVSGDWDEANFLIVPPGWRVKATYDGGILEKELSDPAGRAIV